MAEKGTDVREKLIEAAVQLFLEKDFHSVSIRELATRAGVSSGMINYYFKSKNGLFEAMIRSQCEYIQSQVMSLLEEPGEVDFEKIVTAFQSIYRMNPDLAKFEVRTFMDESAFGNQYLKYLFETERTMVRDKFKQVVPGFKRNDERTDTDIEVIRIMTICNVVMTGIMAPTLKKYYGAEEHQQFERRFAEIFGAMVSGYIRH